MTLVLCGLAGFFLAQLVKTVAFPVGLPQWFKLALALLGSAGVAWLTYRRGTSDLVIYAVAGAGLAAVVHKAYRLLSVSGDWLIRYIITKLKRGG